MSHNCALLFLPAFSLAYKNARKKPKHRDAAAGGVFCGHLSIEQSASSCVRITASQITQITGEVKNAALDSVCCGSGP